MSNLRKWRAQTTFKFLRLLVPPLLFAWINFCTLHTDLHLLLHGTACTLQVTAHILGGTHVSFFGGGGSFLILKGGALCMYLAAPALQMSEFYNCVITANFPENLPNFTASNTIINSNFCDVFLRLPILVP